MTLTYSWHASFYLGEKALTAILLSSCSMTPNLISNVQQCYFKFYTESLNQIKELFPLGSEFCKGMKNWAFPTQRAFLSINITADTSFHNISSN